MPYIQEAFRQLNTLLLLTKAGQICFQCGRISAVSLVAVARDWRDPAERRLATSSRDRESGGADSFSLYYDELQCHSPKALLWLK